MGFVWIWGPSLTSCPRGEWVKSAANAYEVRGKTLGLVGYGNIGSQISVMAESVGMKVRFYDTVTKLPIEFPIVFFVRRQMV